MLNEFNERRLSAVSKTRIKEFLRKRGKNFSKDLVVILVRYFREVSLECRMKTSYYFWLLEKEFQENDKGISQIAMVEK